MTATPPTRPNQNYTVTHLFLAFIAGGFTVGIAIGVVLLLQHDAEPQPIVLHPPPHPRQTQRHAHSRKTIPPEPLG